MLCVNQCMLWRFNKAVCDQEIYYATVGDAFAIPGITL